MRSWARAALSAGTAWNARAIRLLKEVGRAIRDAVGAMASWHRGRMSHDPLYPIALAAGGGALIQIFVPSPAVRDLLRVLLQTLLGSSKPSLYDGRYGVDDDGWEDE